MSCVFLMLWNSTIYWTEVSDSVTILVTRLLGCLQFFKLCLQLFHNLFTKHAKLSINIHILNFFFLFTQSCIYHLLTGRNRLWKEPRRIRSDEKVKLAISEKFKGKVIPPPTQKREPRWHNMEMYFIVIYVL